MHSFTIALISTLSLGVHAASIGDSVSHLVTREQHNRLFHNPDFTSANLPTAESFERAGKISPRQVLVGSAAVSNVRAFNGLGGIFTFNDNTRPNTADAVTSFQTLGSVDLSAFNARPNAADIPQAAQAVTGPSLLGSAATLQVSDLLSGMLLNTRPNAANTMPLNAQTDVVDTPATTNNAQTAINAQPNAQPAINAQSSAQPAINAQPNSQPAINAQSNAQAVINAQANAQAAINAQSNSQSVINAQSNSQPAINAQPNAQAAQAAVNTVAPPVVNNPPAQDSAALLAASNLAGPGFSGNAANIGAQQDSQQDAVKRQLPTPALPTLPTPSALPTLPTPSLPTLPTAREVNTEFFDGQFEDMDFSAHDSEADELEEGF